jgi:hypothetical protein
MPMPTAKEYRRQAQECGELARVARDQFAQQAMAELAEELNKAADALERKSAPNRFPREPSSFNPRNWLWRSGTGGSHRLPTGLDWMHGLRSWRAITRNLSWFPERFMVPKPYLSQVNAGSEPIDAARKGFAE